VINLLTKFEVSMFTHYKDTKGNKNVKIGVVFILGGGLGHRQCHHSTECIQIPIQL